MTKTSLIVKIQRKPRERRRHETIKLVSIDCEMTGLDSERCELIEFGAVLDDTKVMAPLQSLPRFHCYFHQDFLVGEPFALSMHAEILRRIAHREKGYTYLSPMKFGNAFKQFLIANGYETDRDRVTINVAGKNYGMFDHRFLSKKTDLEKHVKVRSRIIDPAILFYENGDEALPGMEECLRRAGLPCEVSHNAVDDALQVVQLVRYRLGK